MSGDFSLKGRLKNVLEPLIKSSDASDAKGKLLLDKLLAGDSFFVSYEAPESVVFSFPASDADWQVLTATATKAAYGSSEVYLEDSMYLVKLGQYVVVSPAEAAIQKAVDLAEGKLTDSLAKNTEYKQFTSSYFSPRMLGATIDMKGVTALFDQFVDGSNDVGDDEQKVITAVKELLALIKFGGGSLAETPAGYQFNMKVKGDEQKLTAEGLSFNPGGSFTPTLYRQLPNAKPIFLSESFNAKADYLQTKAFLNKFLQKIGMEDYDSLNTELKTQTGVDMEEIYNIMDGEVVCALQYDANKVLPYFTILANVETNAAKAAELTTRLVTAIKGNVPYNIYKATSDAGLTKFTFDVTKIEDYDGPSAFPKIEVTIGVDSNGLLIISNYPSISDKSLRTGFVFDYSTPESNGFVYISMRNVWEWFDKLLSWAEEVSVGTGNGPKLSFYQDYYSALEQIYTWKDLFIQVNSTVAETTITGTVAVDNAKHKTYEEVLGGYRSKDTDDDGASDYEEKYIYNTPIDNADSNGNGVSDIDELKKGMNPNGSGMLFKDLNEDEYYTESAALLYQRKAIAGYSDGTFQPGKLVNRAEFATMVVKAFESGSSNMLGINMEISGGYSPFQDVDSDKWYYKPIAKAYSAGLISGSKDAKGRLVFRPGDPITRAEALGILNKASAALKKTKETNLSCSGGAFNDVSENDWFCGAVSNGYANGITSGKSKGKFEPFENLTRAEAAVMVRRALDKDIDLAGQGTQSLEEMSLPMLKGAAKLF